MTKSRLGIVWDLGPDWMGEGWRRRHCFRERTIIYLDCGDGYTSVYND